jgi:hypothetical protein
VARLVRPVLASTCLDLGRTRWQFKDYTHQKARPQLVYLDYPDGAGDCTALSSEARASLKLAVLISSGLSAAEAGAIFGISTKSVNTAMQLLREEIRAQHEG